LPPPPTLLTPAPQRLLPRLPLQPRTPSSPPIPLPPIAPSRQMKTTSPQKTCSPGKPPPLKSLPIFQARSFTPLSSSVTPESLAMTSPALALLGAAQSPYPPSSACLPTTSYDPLRLLSSVSRMYILSSVPVNSPPDLAFQSSCSSSLISGVYSPSPPSLYCCKFITGLPLLLLVHTKCFVIIFTIAIFCYPLPSRHIKPISCLHIFSLLNSQNVPIDRCTYICSINISIHTFMFIYIYTHPSIFLG
jgi:hypothetical protein